MARPTGAESDTKGNVVRTSVVSHTRSGVRARCLRDQLVAGDGHSGAGCMCVVRLQGQPLGCRRARCVVPVCQDLAPRHVRRPLATRRQVERASRMDLLQGPARPGARAAGRLWHQGRQAHGLEDNRQGVGAAGAPAARFDQAPGGRGLPPGYSCARRTLRASLASAFWPASFACRVPYWSCWFASDWVRVVIHGSLEQ
jgi:hypothetical protein